MPVTESRELGSFWHANDNVAELFAKVVFSILTDYMQTFGKANSLTYIGIPQAKLQFKTNSRASTFHTCTAHEEARSTSGIHKG